MERSFETVRGEDLERLAELALEDQEGFFNRNTDYSAYRDRLLCIALCQGAALHMVDGQTGIKDFDVWSFFAAIEGLSLPYRRPRTIKDFGDPRFGKTTDRQDFVGRRVDILLRSIAADGTDDPIGPVVRYLERRKSKTARALSLKAVICLYPINVRGFVLWPPTHRGRIVP